MLPESSFLAQCIITSMQFCNQHQIYPPLSFWHLLGIQGWRRSGAPRWFWGSNPNIAIHMWHLVFQGEGKGNKDALLKTGTPCSARCVQKPGLCLFWFIYLKGSFTTRIPWNRTEAAGRHYPEEHWLLRKWEEWEHLDTVCSTHHGIRAFGSVCWGDRQESHSGSSGQGMVGTLCINSQGYRKTWSLQGHKDSTSQACALALIYSGVVWEKLPT